MLIFSHYEVCHDSDGWRWLKAWYIDSETGERRWLAAD
jgi:hypothetical protein